MSQNYHTAFIADRGLDSPLLDLLDVRYVLVPDTLPRDRPEMARLIENSKVVFQDPQVTVTNAAQSPRTPGSCTMYGLWSRIPRSSLHR